MGLFDFFKKRVASAKFEETVNVPQYNPWKTKGGARNDDYAIAAFISVSQNGAKVGLCNDDYPRYFSYEYRVNDPVKFHKKVIEQGYLTEGGPEHALKSFKVERLKGILQDNGLPIKGKKEELIARIVKEVDINSLDLEKYYIPTEKGLQHLKKYEYALRLKNYNISFEQYDAFKKECHEYAKPNDIIWQLLNNRYNTHNMSGDYGLARNELLHMANLLEFEKRYIDALCFFVKVLYYDTSGCANCGIIKKKEDIAVCPGVVASIHSLKEYYEPRVIDKCFSTIYLPNHYVSKKNFHTMLMDIFEDEPIDFMKYTNKK